MVAIPFSRISHVAETSCAVHSILFIVCMCVRVQGSVNFGSQGIRSINELTIFQFRDVLSSKARSISVWSSCVKWKREYEG